MSWRSRLALFARWRRDGVGLRDAALLAWYGLVPIAGGTTCTAHLHQNAFRGRNDDGDQAGASWKEAENTNWTQATGERFRIRFEIEESANCSAMNQNFGIQRNLGGLGWVDITAVSSVVRFADSPHITDGVATTNQMTTSSTGFVAGQVKETGVTGNITLQNSHTESEWVLELVSSDVDHLDTIQFRAVTSGGALTEYHQTPTVTISKAAAIEGAGALVAGSAVVAGAGETESAFPTTAAPTVTAITSTTTAHTINLPACGTGKLLLIFSDFDAGATPSGWTAGYTQVGLRVGAAVTLEVRYRFTTGGEGSTISVTTDISTRSAHHVYCIDAVDTETPPEGLNGTFIVSGAGTSADPPELIPSWGATDTLWFAVVATSANQDDITGTPASYTDLVTTDQNSGGISTIRRELNATSDDPSAFTFTASKTFLVNTVAVRPGAPAGAGIEGAGALVAGSAVVDGSGASASTGTGALVADAATVSGAGTSASAGTGALEAQAATLAGTGTGETTGAGALAAAAAVVDGAGVSGSAGTGALTAQAAVIDGAGELVGGEVTGVGVLEAQAATVAGAGLSGSTGDGTLVAGAAAVDGTGTTVSTGSGALEAQAAQVDGAGTTASVGTGALAAQAAEVTGAGLGITTGSGALVAGAAVVAGAGDVEVESITGTGALAAQAATVAGEGFLVPIPITGTGALVAGAAVVAGLASGSTSGAGELQAQGATLTALGDVAWYATGALQCQSAVVAGEGTVLSASTAGDLQAGAATVVGVGLVSGSGTAPPRILLTPGTARVHALAFAGARVSATTTATTRTVTVTPGDIP